MPWIRWLVHAAVDALAVARAVAVTVVGVAATVAAGCAVLIDALTGLV